MKSPTVYTKQNQGLFELPLPSPGWEAEHGAPNLDVVAVHGLNGECYRTWTYYERTGEKTLWLNDLLLHKLPRTRVMTFGYDASAINSNSVAGVRESARALLLSLREKRARDGTSSRPIVFVGHSLGGIVIKQALRIARNEQNLEIVARSTKGIVFFGTPHRGSDFARWGELLAKVMSASSSTPKTSFLKLLRRNSDGLTNLSDDFRPISQDYAIESFIEAQQVTILGFNSVVVPKQSAATELPHEKRMYMNGDHSTMCKFSREPDDAGRFDAVWRSIQRVAKGTDTRPAPNIYDVYQQLTHGGAVAGRGAARIGGAHAGAHAGQPSLVWSAAPASERMLMGVAR